MTEEAKPEREKKSRSTHPDPVDAGSKGNPSEQEWRWLELFRLGQRLMGNDSGLTTIYETVSPEGFFIQTASNLIDGKVDVWLAGDSIPGFLKRKLMKPSEGDMNPSSASLSGSPPTGWMEQAFTEIRRVCAQRSEDGTWKEAESQAQVIAIPIYEVSGESFGVVQFSLQEDRSFSSEECEFLDALASQLATALRAAVRSEIEQRRIEQLTAVYQVSNAIASILDPDKLLEEVVNLIFEHLDYPFVHLFTVHPGRRKVIYAAGSGSRSQALGETGYILDLDDPEGLVSWVARNGDTLLVNDIDKEPLYRQSPLPPYGTQSELTVPLIYGSEILGVLDIQSDQLEAFDDDDRYLFESLADNIAVALHNANIFRSEIWRRQVSDSLHEVAGLLSADVDLNHVLDVILQELVHNLPCDVASIWLLDEGSLEGASSSEFESITEDFVDGMEESLPPLRLVALHGPLASVLDMAQGLSLESFIDCGTDLQEEVVPDVDTTLIVDALFSEEPVVRMSAMLRDPLAASLEFPDDYSAIASPLRVGDQRLGVLMLLHHTSGRYGREASNITATFSSYAAVAIENTRLFESAHEQAWVSTVLLQVAEATQTITNSDELLDAISRITPMLVGVNSCTVFTIDDTQEGGVIFSPAASAGLGLPGLQAFTASQIQVGDIPEFDQLLNDRRASIRRIERGEATLLSRIFNPDEIRDSSQNEASEGGVSSMGNRDTRPGLRLDPIWIIIVPLMGRESIMGAFLVSFSPDPVMTNISTVFEETISIVQGVAQQLAMAVENIRLARIQKEEAYVSVALLQVAQAVVSNNELYDILGSVVRITPILVGIRRVAIFLWDSILHQFILTQGYGISREAEGRVFLLGTFPLLDLVNAEDTMIACPIDGDQPGEMLEAWAQVTIPEAKKGSLSSKAADILDSERNLLLAFPLSVKGQPLGVFLVEEPGNIVGGESGQEGLNRRLREKRMEIMTGITQQVALAIQNDSFQRETLERERLEQEMLLARQIQQTFLPDQVPELPGWDLNVYWRPAREVAGDFYDFFHLSGDRLGLVIADVADKGMPAALFMTLVRALMRATVQQMDNPAEVLARVNDVLVPDAQQGMFVTLFYAVLDLRSGSLVYSNAGHNPPIIYHFKDNSAQRQEKGEIALGVLEGSQYSINVTQLDQEDFLVLYTDGVTEAFSPSNEMYGEEGLLQTICQMFEHKQHPSARELLVEIDNEVRNFAGENELADDLTLLVVRRDGS